MTIDVRIQRGCINEASAEKNPAEITRSTSPRLFPLWRDFIIKPVTINIQAAIGLSYPTDSELSDKVGLNANAQAMRNIYTPGPNKNIEVEKSV